MTKTQFKRTPEIQITSYDVEDDTIADNDGDYKIVFVKDGETVDAMKVTADEFYDLLSRYDI